jgi:hypothetical protein
MSQGEYILQHDLWDKKLNTKWNILNVYGTTHEEDREIFLTELAFFCAKSKVPYIAGVISTFLDFLLRRIKISTLIGSLTPLML